MNEPDDTAPERYRLYAAVCKVLTEPKRLLILDALRHGDRSVGDLATIIGVTLPNASQHLAVMRNAGLVEGRRTGTTIVYRLAEPTIVDACDVIHRIVERRITGPAVSAATASAATASAAAASAREPMAALGIVNTPAVRAVAEMAGARLERAIDALRTRP